MRFRDLRRVSYRNVKQHSQGENGPSGIWWISCSRLSVPYAIIFAMNVAIIIRISTRNRSIKTLLDPFVLHNCMRVMVTPESEPQPQHNRGYHLTQNQVTANYLKAEKSVTLMLLVTTFAFLLMCTPIAVCHSLQTLLTEEKLFVLIEPVTCMAAFAVAEMLAFGQHAIQFYVYFACSARFRQAILWQFHLSTNRLGRFLSRLLIPPPDLETRYIPFEQHRDPAFCQYRVLRCSLSQTHEQTIGHC